MRVIRRESIEGTQGDLNPAPLLRNGDRIILKGVQTINGAKINSVFGLNNTDLASHILAIGGNGSGKTNCINTIVDQVKATMTDEDVMIIFDYKGDFYEEFYEEHRQDCVLATTQKLRDKSVHWNVFSEILADGEDIMDIEANAGEIANALYADMQNVQTPFFTLAPAEIVRTLFVAIVQRFLKEKKKNGSVDAYGKEIIDIDIEKVPTNGVFVKICEELGSKDRKEIVAYCRENYSEDVARAFSLANPSAAPTYGSVMGELFLMLERRFMSVFGSETGGSQITERDDFGIRTFVREKKGRTLFIEYDAVHAESLSPNYCLLVDLAITEAISNGRGNVFLVVDELAHLPFLKKISEALNAGRSLGLKIIAGLQNIGQMKSKYGEDETTAIFGGFMTTIVFRCGDNDTREYCVELCGKNRYNEKFVNGIAIGTREVEGHVVEDWFIQGLNRGEAFVKLCQTVNQNGEWFTWHPFRFWFDKYVPRSSRNGSV